MEFKEAVRRRRMVRNYEDRHVPEDKLTSVLNAARRAPSAGFSQGQSFVVVTDAEVRARVAEIAGEPGYVKQGFDPWISRAPVHIICCTSEKLYRDRYSEPDKASVEKDWVVPYWWVDAGAVMMLILLAAVDEGLAAGFLGLSPGGHARLKELLGIPDHVTPIGIVSLGYRAPDRRSGSLARGYRPEEEVVHRDRWRGSDAY